MGSGEAVSTATTFCGEGLVAIVDEDDEEASMLLEATELPVRVELSDRSAVCCRFGDSERGGIVGCERVLELGTKTFGKGLMELVAAISAVLVVDDIFVK